LLARLQEVFEEQRGNDALVLALVSGAGDRSFAAGGDLRDLEEVRTLEQARALFDLGNGAFDAIRTFPVPVVAALNGLALGGGAELAVACDVRIAAAHARIGFVQGTLKHPTAWGGGSDSRGDPRSCAQPRAPVQRARAVGCRSACDGSRRGRRAGGRAVRRFRRALSGSWMKQRPQVMRAFKWQSAARKQGMGRAHAEQRDRDLFAHAWCHAEHWQAAKDILSKEAK